MRRNDTRRTPKHETMLKRRSTFEKPTSFKAERRTHTCAKTTQRSEMAANKTRHSTRRGSQTKTICVKTRSAHRKRNEHSAHEKREDDARLEKLRHDRSTWHETRSKDKHEANHARRQKRDTSLETQNRTRKTRNKRRQCTPEACDAKQRNIYKI